MERPLDTIRSFEAAIEGTYNSRRSTFPARPGTLKQEVKEAQLLRLTQYLKQHLMVPADEAAISEVCHFRHLLLIKQHILLTAAFSQRYEW